MIDVVVFVLVDDFVMLRAKLNMNEAAHFIHIMRSKINLGSLSEVRSNLEDMFKKTH